ncbi:hypothetical protein [Roseateles noduli]|uniref:hypothetical protein n=1 Tax=Roseateles noduli TaxID=2052484 RepID=UPI003D662AB4
MADKIDAWLSVYTIEDFDDWMEWLSKAATTAARPSATMDRRARCPICDASPFATHGFRLPLGLVRHVRGSHGQPQCVIAEAAQDLALAAVRERSDGKWRPLLRSEMFEVEKPWARQEERPGIALDLAQPQSAEVIPLRRRPAADTT